MKAVNPELEKIREIPYLCPEDRKSKLYYFFKEDKSNK